MKLSNRQRRLLESLMNRSGEVTASELAQDAAISARTVHRELLELEPILSAYGMRLVKKSGVGILLEGGPAELAKLQEALRGAEMEAYSPDERKALMLILLLQEREPIKLFALASVVQAAIPTVGRDLDELTRLLHRSGLTLVRRRGYGVEIEGPEAARRRLIAWMAEEYLDHADWFGSPAAQGEQGAIVRRMLELAGKPIFHQVEQWLWEQGEESLSRLKESDYTRLLIRLTIAVARVRSGHEVKPEEVRGYRGGRTAMDDPLLAGLADALGLSLSEAESRYLLHVLEEARDQASDVSSVILEKYGLALAERALALIHAVEARQAAEFGKDRSLLDGLIRHLGPALDRIRRQESIRNPLLSQIRRDYAGLFATVRACADGIWPELSVPDEEIGYLTMHFGAASERWRLTPGNVRALLVCTSGIGSSKLLAVRITKEMPQIELVGLYSWYEAARVPEDRYDLIISTVDLPVQAERYVKLSPLLTAEETERLRACIQSLASKSRPPQTQSGPAGKASTWDRLRRKAKYATAVVDLLEPFRVYNWNNGPERQAFRERTIRSIVGEVARANRLTHEERIAQALIDRERQGSLMIPDTSIALYHTRSEWVPEPILRLFRLQAPIRLDEEPESEVRCILLMLAPASLGKHVLEILSEISAMLLQPEFVRLLEGDGDEERIRAYLSHHLDSFIQNNLEWGDA